MSRVTLLEAERQINALHQILVRCDEINRGKQDDNPTHSDRWIRRQNLKDNLNIVKTIRPLITDIEKLVTSLVKLANRVEDDLYKSLLACQVSTATEEKVDDHG